MMETDCGLPLILPTDKRNPSLTLWRDDQGQTIHVYYGMEVMEVVPDDRPRDGAECFGCQRPGGRQPSRGARVGGSGGGTDPSGGVLRWTGQEFEVRLVPPVNDAPALWGVLEKLLDQVNSAGPRLPDTSHRPLTFFLSQRSDFEIRLKGP